MLIYDEDLEILDLTCDFCGEMSTYDGKWHECLKDAKVDGWSLNLVGNESTWEEYCINCSLVEV